MAEGYFILPGTTGNFLSTPASATLEVPGDLEIVVRVALADWTPATATTLIANQSNLSTAVDGYSFSVNTAGTLRLSVGDGTARSVSSSVAPGAIDGTALWLKATIDINNGASGRTVQFFTALDSENEPTSWTQLGTTVTTAGALTSLTASTLPLRIGAISTGANLLNGSFYRAIVRSGIGGVTKFDTGGVDVPLVTTATTYRANSGQTVTINRSGSPSTLIIKRTTSVIYGTGVPSYEIIDQFEADVVKVESWVDIYNSDNTTLWMQRVPVTEGTVTVDMNRSERRNFDVTMSDSDGSIGYGPGAFWYDKVLKPYRGIRLANGDTWVAPLGEFLPDAISRPHFPSTIRASCRDFSKKLILDKFAVGTTFAAGANIGTVCQAIATNGGVTKFNFSPTTSVLQEAVSYEIGDERWKAISELAASIGFEVFFNAYGFLVFRPYVDPMTAPVSYTFRTGGDGNLVNFERSTSDTFLFNDVVVYGNGLIYGRATNTNPLSPTNTTAIGVRLRKLENKFVANNTAATEVATAYLKVSGLEQYDMNVESLIVPWLEAGDAVELLLPDAAPGDPTRFLLTNFTIPLGLGSMSGTAKRVTIVV